MRCGIGFGGGQGLSLADYVTGMKPTRGATAAGRCEGANVAYARASVRRSRGGPAVTSSPGRSSSRLDEALADSRAYLRSDLATASLAKSCYWPKWDSPWWHVLALIEAGHVEQIPKATLLAIYAACQHDLLPFFPTSPEQLPPGTDPRIAIPCHCQLGCLLEAAPRADTLDVVHTHLPWARDWFQRYQLPDGGWNCDEAAYTREQPRSSVVSTVVVLEHLVAKPDLSETERGMLERGMQFLLELRLFRSRRTGAILDEDWLVPTLPRFYEYDLLRGLRLVAAWIKLRGFRTEQLDHTLSEAVRHVDRFFASHRAPRGWATDERTRKPHGVETTFPLLDVLEEHVTGLQLLAEEWRAVREVLT